MPDSEDTVEGYHIHVGGGYGPDAAIGRELFRDIKATEAPQTVANGILKAYIAHRAVARGDVRRVSPSGMRSMRIKAWADAERRMT